MAIYSVTAPNGIEYEVEGPDGASESDVIAQVQSHLGSSQDAGAGRGLLSSESGQIADDAPDTGDETARLAARYKAPVPERTWGDVGNDALVTAVKSAIGLPQGLAGIADIPTFGYAGKALDSLGFRPAEAQKVLDGMYSDATRDDKQYVNAASGFVDTIQRAIERPSTIATTVGESAGSMLGGAGIARGVIGAAAGKVAPWLAGAIGEGAFGAGSAAAQMREESTDGTLSGKQVASALGSGAGTAVLGAAGGKLAQKLGIADIDTMLAQGAGKLSQSPVGFVKAVIGSGVSEGVFEELPQSAQEQMWQNYATGKPLMDGVENAAAMGMMAGVTMGSAGGGFNALASGNAAIDQERAKLEQYRKIESGIESDVRKQGAEYVMGATSADEAAQRAAEVVSQSPSRTAKQILTESGIAKPDPAAMMAKLVADIDPESIAPVEQMAAKADEVVGDAAPLEQKSASVESATLTPQQKQAQVRAEMQGAVSTLPMDMDAIRQRQEFARIHATARGAFDPLAEVNLQTGANTSSDDVKRLVTQARQAVDEKETAEIQRMLADDAAAKQELADAKQRLDTGVRADSDRETQLSAADGLAQRARTRLLDSLVASYAEPTGYFAAPLLKAVTSQLGVLQQPALTKQEQSRITDLVTRAQAFVSPNLPSDKTTAIPDTGADNASMESLIKERQQKPAGVAATVRNQQPRTNKAPKPLLTDTERDMLGDFERMYQADRKGEIKSRLGLVPARQDEATAPAEKRKPSELLAAIKRAGGIKSTNAGDLMGGSAMDANRILPGLFRNDGMNLDLLVPFLKERGYLTQADEDNIKDNGGVNKLAEILQSELSGDSAQTVDSTAGYEADADNAMRSELDSKAFALGLPMKVTNEMSTERLNGVINRIERKFGKPVNADFATRKMSRTEAMAERQAILMADRVERARAQYDADIQAFAEANDRVQEAVLDVMVDEDGNIEIIYESTVGEAYDNRNVQEDSGQAGAPVAQGARAGSGNPEANSAEAGADQEALTTYTPAEVTARQAATAQAEAATKRAEDAAARAEAAAKQVSEIAQRSVAAADTFELGGNAEDNLSGQEGFKFSKAEQSPRTQASTIRTAITNAYGNLLTRLEGKGLASLTQTEEEAIAAAAQARADQTGGDVEAIKESLRKSVLASEASDIDVKRSADGNLEGFFDPTTGKSFLIADNLTAESAPATLMHEVGIHMAADGKLEPLFKRAATLLKMGRNNPFIQRVQSRMDESNETSAEEAAAYIVTEYEKDRINAPQSVVSWIKDLMADVRAWLFSKGVIISASQLTVADIAAVARANARSIAHDGKASTEVADSATVFNSKKDGQDGFWQRLARGDSFSATEYVSALEGDLRNEGRGSYRGRVRFASGLGTHLAHWGRPIAGFSDYYSLAVKDKRGDFTVLAIPTELVKDRDVSAQDLHDLAVSRFTIFRNKFGKLELAVSEPDQGTTAYKALQARGTVTLSDQWTANGDHQYSRVDVGSAEMRKLVRETVRRYAMSYGDIEDVLIPRRDTGANKERSREFSRDDIKLRFSKKSRPTQGQRFAIDDESKTELTRRKFQDSFLRVKTVQDAISKQGGTVNELNDVYGAEERMHGIVEEKLKDFYDDHLSPLSKKLSAAKLTLDELALYAYAKHAPERNAHIANINDALPDGGSGMTNQEAADILTKFQQEGKAAALSDAHKDLMAIGQLNRDEMLAYGLITQAQYNSMSQWQNYVPLRGFEGDEDIDAPVTRGAGRGFNIRGKETMRALGRESRAAELIENLVTDYERTLSRGERNDVGARFLQLVQDNPDPTLWEIDRKMTKAAWDRQAQSVKYTRMVDKADTVAVKVNGKEVYITVKDPLLARALKGKTTTQAAVDHVLANSLGRFNSFLRATLTQYNPVFPLTNYARDVGMGAVSMVDDLGYKGAAKFAKYQTQVWGAAHRFVTGKLDPAKSPLDKMFVEYKAAGGTTGGFYAKDAEQIRSEIHNIMLASGAAPVTKMDKLKTLGGRTTLAIKGVSAVGNVLSHMGELTESVTRFAGYCAAREMGKTPAQAASIAKNMTTNFNRKGEFGAALNSSFLFFNAAVQGSARVVKALKNPKVLGGPVAMMIAAGFMLAGAGGEDDDGQPYWDKIEDYVKDRNLIIMLPPGSYSDQAQHVGTNGRYLKIPMPYGFNTFVVLGYAMKDIMRNQQNDKHGVSYIKGALRVVKAVNGSFNPVAGDLDPNNNDSKMQALLPTAADVVYQQIYGVNGFSKPTAPRKDDEDISKPDAENVNPRQAGKYAHKIARWLNENTGGDKVSKGVLDFNPGTIENLVRTTTGGTGVVLADAASLIWTSGDPTVENTARDIPVLRNFYGEVDGVTNVSQMYERIHEAKNAMKLVKADAENGGQSKNVGDEERRLASLASTASKYTKALSTLRKQEININDSDASAAEKRARSKEIRLQRERLADQFNAIYYQVARVGDSADKK